MNYEDNIAIENERRISTDYEDRNNDNENDKKENEELEYHHHHRKHKHIKSIFKRMQKHKYRNPGQKRSSEIQTKGSNELSVIFKVYLFIYLFY